MKGKNKMKKLLFVFTAMCIALLSVMSFSAYAADGVNVTVNGEAIEFDASPVIISGRTMIPARAVFEKMGATVLWDPYSEGGYVSVITPDESVVVFASAAGGENYMVKDNFKKIGLDSPAVIREGRTLVPLRAISEAFGAGVSWDGETRTAAITFEPVEKGLDEATVSANEAVLFEDAEKEISAKDGEAEVSPMPMYENGSKFYRGVCAKEQKQYKYGSDKTASESEYKLYGTINGKVIPYNEFEYYLKVVKDNALYSGEELSEESAKEKAEKEMFFLRVAAAKSEADGVETDKEFYDTADYFSRMYFMEEEE